MSKYTSHIISIISLLVFGYVFYQSEFVYDGTNRHHYFKFYILTIILMIFSLQTYFFNNIINTYLKILFFSTIIGVYLFEYYLINLSTEIVKIKDNKIKIYEETTKKKFDQRTQYEVYLDLKKNNNDVSPYFYPKLFYLNDKKIYSLSGVAKKQTVFCNENGYYSITKSDRYGFNNPDTEWETNEFDYVFVGDSFTQGFCVNRPDDIPSVIRNATKKKVLNLGYGKNGPLTNYATLREYLPKKAKKIFFMYNGGNDLIDLNRELNNQILLKYLNDDDFKQNLKYIQKKLDLEKEKSIYAKAAGNKFNFLKIRETRSKFKHFFITKRKIEKKTYDFKIFEKILLKTKKLSIENKSQLYFVFLPNRRYFKGIINRSMDDEKYFDEIKYIVEKNDITFIDIHDLVFKKEKNPLDLFPFQNYGHYNVLGYNKVAMSILNFRP